MMNFINNFNILNSNPFGYIPANNTSDVLLEFLYNAYEAMNKNKVFLAFFLDFSKTYDTVDHGILLRELEFIGFRRKRLQ